MNLESAYELNNLINIHLHQPRRRSKRSIKRQTERDGGKQMLYIELDHDSKSIDTDANVKSIEAVNLGQPTVS